MLKIFDYISSQQVINVAGLASVIYTLTQLFQLNISQEEITAVIGAFVTLGLFFANIVRRAQQKDLKYGFLRKE